MPRGYHLLPVLETQIYLQLHKGLKITIDIAELALLWSDNIVRLPELSLSNTIDLSRHRRPSSMASNYVQPATKPYGVVLHAGARDTWKYDPRKQRDTQVTLKKIVAKAELELLNGASAIDVVRDAVTALEDCESFNAGRGAVLNIDGEHEVSRSFVCQIVRLVPQK